MYDVEPLSYEQRATEWDIHSADRWGYIEAECKELISVFLSQRLATDNLDIGGGWYEHVPNSTVIDLSMEALRINPSLSKVRVDLEDIASGGRLPFVDNSFRSASLVLAWAYISDPKTVLSEIERVLIPGAEVYIVNQKDKALRDFNVNPVRVINSELIGAQVRRYGYDCVVEEIPSLFNNLHSVTITMPDRVKNSCYQEGENSRSKSSTSD